MTPYTHVRRMIRNALLQVGRRQLFFTLISTIFETQNGLKVVKTVEIIKQLLYILNE